MVISKVAKWTTAICLVLFLHNVGFAQAVNNAQVHGMVLDQSGAAVVGAQITATQKETGQVQVTVSGGDGSFVLPGLPVGAYSLQISAKGFTRYTQTGLVLQVGQNVHVNIPLTVGSVSQEVQVSADAAMIETQDTSISTVMDQQRIVDLPLNGRQATDLILLSAGAAQPPNASSRVVTSHDYVNSVGVSVSGGQINGNNYLLDGGDNNDSHSNVNMPFPFPDALQEYNVQTNGISSRYGLHPGSVINVVVKQGGNSFHGDLFEFVRTPNLNAQNRFTVAPAKDALHRNQFGGTIGGPILRNKLFGFGGFQETIIRNVSGSNTAFVPTQAALNGDFSALESGPTPTSQGCLAKARTLKNPATGVNYVNNQIPTNSFSTPAVNLTKIMLISTD